MGSECRHDPHGAIQSLLTHSGPIRDLNLSSNPIRRCFTRQKLVVDVVGACMDTIFSRQNYRSSLLRKSFFRGARDVGRCSVRRFSGHLDFFRFPHFPIQTQCSFLLYTPSNWPAIPVPKIREGLFARLVRRCGLPLVTTGVQVSRLHLLCVILWQIPPCSIFSFQRDRGSKEKAWA